MLSRMPSCRHSRRDGTTTSTCSNRRRDSKTARQEARHNTRNTAPLGHSESGPTGAVSCLSAIGPGPYLGSTASRYSWTGLNSPYGTCIGRSASEAHTIASSSSTSITDAFALTTPHAT